jgi:hypothetical protein
MRGSAWYPKSDQARLHLLGVPQRPIRVIALGGLMGAVMGWARFVKEVNQASSLIGSGHFEQFRTKIATGAV